LTLIHTEWELQTATLPDIPSTSEIIEFLETRCKALELLQANQPIATSTPNRSTAGNKVNHSTKCHMTTQQVQCPLCNGTHCLCHCDDFIHKSPTQRLEYMKQSRACYNCLQPYNKSHTCSKYACRTCNKKHHTLLHTAMQKHSADRKVDGTFTSNGRRVTTRATNQQSNTPASDCAANEAQTYCSFKNKATTHVLLATALVEVKNKFNQYVPCRVLLDSASQVNFITERCVQRLRLSRNQTATSIQGINNVNTATHRSVCIHIRSRKKLAHISQVCTVAEHNQQLASNETGYFKLEHSNKHPTR
jgi:hypothetical protein